MTAFTLDKNIDDFQRQIQDFPKGGGGCREYGYFILGHFVAGHIMRFMDKMSADKILDDKMPVEIAREDQMLAIL